MGIPGIDAGQFLNGLGYGMLLFLIASGLTIIFGIMNVVNFAHGTLYMLGAYVAVVIASQTGNFWVGLLAAPVAVAVVGAIFEMTAIRAVSKRPPVSSLLLTFGFTLFLGNVIRLLWGTQQLTMSVPDVLQGAVNILGTDYPAYRLFIIVFGILVAVGMAMFLEYTSLGTIVRAASTDPEMVALLGIPISRVFTAVFAIGSILAAFGGVVAVPLLTAHIGMDLEVIVDSFVILVIGGLGSFRGAILAALIVGQVETIGRVYLSEYAMAVTFVFMAIVLLARPTGLLGEGRVG
ncbi:MAG: branched-chain amino acid ABC transporter permease [Chloroflexi bacterium]|nr:branched-chain amino acid ABC transporter permease [Chloroflexota bacterium]